MVTVVSVYLLDVDLHSFALVLTRVVHPEVTQLRLFSSVQLAKLMGLFV